MEPFLPLDSLKHLNYVLQQSFQKSCAFPFLTRRMTYHETLAKKQKENRTNKQKQKVSVRDKVGELTT